MVEGNDKRRSARVNYLLVVDVWSPVRAGHVCKGCITDVSATGLGIEIVEAFPEGNEVMLNFTLPPRDFGFHGMRAEVMRSFKKGPNFTTGLRFLDLTPKQARMLKKAIRYLSKHPGG
jgi:hypothetical protein